MSSDAILSFSLRSKNKRELCGKSYIPKDPLRHQHTIHWRENAQMPSLPNKTARKDNPTFKAALSVIYSIQRNLRNHSSFYSMLHVTWTTFKFNRNQLGTVSAYVMKYSLLTEIIIFTD